MAFRRFFVTGSDIRLRRAASCRVINDRSAARQGRLEPRRELIGQLEHPHAYSRDQ